MPDFLDRLIARSGRPDGGPGGRAAAGGPGRLAGMAVARPHVPGLFERLAPPAPENDLEAEAVAPPARLEFTHPPLTTAPAAAQQPRTHARLIQAPAAYLGREQDHEPHPPLPAAVAALLPVTPQLMPGPVAAPAVRPFGQEGTPTVRMHPSKDRGGAPGTPAVPRLDGPPAPQAWPRIAAAAPTLRVRVAQPGRATASQPPHVSPSPAGPTVRISIGRIEIRPSGPPGGHGPAQREAARPAPALSLDRFLAGKTGER